MANQQHVDLIRRDVDAWNAWRAGEPKAKPDLSDADLSKADLVMANLAGAVLRGADLTLANLRAADLQDADLSGANLVGARLLGAQIAGADLSGADLRTAEDITQEELEETRGDDRTLIPEELDRPARWRALAKVNLAQVFAGFSETWSPKIVGDVNEMHVKVVKVTGEFIWHHHDTEDELFLIVKGRLLMRFRDREVRLEAGEFLIVPHGVEHQPVAEGECEILLIEPKSTLNTGNVRNERTVEKLDRLA